MPGSPTTIWPGWWPGIRTGSAGSPRPITGVIFGTRA